LLQTIEEYLFQALEEGNTDAAWLLGNLPIYSQNNSGFILSWYQSELNRKTDLVIRNPLLSIETLTFLLNRLEFDPIYFTIDIWNWLTYNLARQTFLLNRSRDRDVREAAEHQIMELESLIYRILDEPRSAHPYTIYAIAVILFTYAGTEYEKAARNIIEAIFEEYLKLELELEGERKGEEPEALAEAEEQKNLQDSGELVENNPAIIQAIRDFLTGDYEINEPSQGEDSLEMADRLREWLKERQIWID
jgi:hypothetical protein